MTISISLIIPAFNEAERLPQYLTTIRAYGAEHLSDRYEVLVVDDGSSDGSKEAIERIATDWPQLTVLQHAQNRGKGAAVRTGMLAAQGELLLFADADGATAVEEEKRLRAAIDDGADVAVGSRLVAGHGIVIQRTWSRAVIGRLFALAARGLLEMQVRDTQCGFKMFRREPGRQLFEQLTEERFLFDLELLMLANRFGYRVAEVPVNWSDQPGSQLSPSRESWRILKGLWRLRRRQITLNSFE
ncbi:MAG: dolichyl-phosphate beta-glucosyltransferase [Pirellulaceae bacterium]